MVQLWLKNKHINIMKDNEFHMFAYKQMVKHTLVATLVNDFLEIFSLPGACKQKCYMDTGCCAASMWQDSSGFACSLHHCLQMTRDQLMAHEEGGKEGLLTVVRKPFVCKWQKGHWKEKWKLLVPGRPPFLIIAWR